MSRPKKIIGRRDKIDLPGLGIKKIKAKIDTGAYGSVIHCNAIEVIQRHGKNVLSFVLLDPSYPGYSGYTYYFNAFRDKKVKSSSGETEHRYSIVTDVIIFGKRIETEFSLTDRSQMKYPILLGRKFLRRRFLVDVSLQDVSYQRKQKK